MKLKTFFALALFVALSCGTLGLRSARADDTGLDQVGRGQYLDSLKGKKVIFIPIAMGFDLTESWAAIWRKEAQALGFTFDIRDPNWSTDAGTKALTAAIAEKPDLLIVHNPDIQSYARLLKRAQDDGIKVLQINMPSVTTTDSYVGADWVALGEEEASALVDHCSAGKGPSTKIAFVQGVVTGAANIYLKRGISNVLSQHSDIKIVSDQAANYDPAKARAIMETVLQQNPDLCGAVGVWDSADVGIGAAVQAAGKTGQVFVVTSGGGNKSACDNIEKGLLSMDVSYNSPLQGNIASQQIAELLQSKDKAGERKVFYFGPLTKITKDNINQRNCWTMDDLK
ncbi:MAG: sugar ABC transporter substrate-binding protein [Roseiarcus sp.]|jgi:simple sugar transport system substrate-binding protein/ribose transport system substrate-binding protein